MRFKIYKMATYNKRGYKTVKDKEQKDANDTIFYDEKKSATAKFFSKLETTAAKTESLVANNQTIIIGIIAAIAIITVGYLGYERFVSTPKENEAASEMFVAQQNFQKAVDGAVSSDSLYRLALNGSEGKFGFIKIAQEYSGTAAGNLANYYAGIAFLNLSKYDDAIQYLSKFKSDDMILGALSKGALGDAYSQKKQNFEALENYIKAFEASTNNFTTPRFLLKAGIKALEIGNKKDALKYFTKIKEDYSDTQESGSVDVLIGMAQ